MSVAIVQLSKTVAAIGVAESLLATDLLARFITIKADPLNTVDMFIGDTTVSSVNGYTLQPGEELKLQDPENNSMERLNLKEIFGVSTAINQKLKVIYIK